MKPDRSSLVLPLLLIAVGSGWLLTTLGVAPAINWVWTLSLAAVGVVTLASAGIDKVTVVVGPIFIVASFLSILRQTGRLPVDVEVPILVIVAGVLLLVARAPAIALPKWVIPDGSKPTRV